MERDTYKIFIIPFFKSFVKIILEVLGVTAELIIQKLRVLCVSGSKVAVGHCPQFKRYSFISYETLESNIM